MRGLADDAVIPLAPDRSTAAVEAEEGHGVGVQDDLRRMPARCERGPCFGRKGGGPPGGRELPGEDVGHERLRVWIRGVEDDESVWAEQRFEPRREGARHSRAR